MIAGRARSDFPGYGEMSPTNCRRIVILGPLQIEAMIDQDTTIARQLTLWDQRGSRVIRGNLLVIPINQSFLYVEPVFLIAEGTNIPQLKRVIVSDGDHLRGSAAQSLRSYSWRASTQERQRSKRPSGPRGVSKADKRSGEAMDRIRA
jgi:uncharacterized membrane protein (UPF0182 family)